MEKQYDVMAAGHVCVDVIPEFPDTGASSIGDILRPGKLVIMGPAKIATGGPVSNTGIALKRLGNRVCFNARIGDDEFGKLTLDYLRNSGNADGIHVVEGAVSSYTIALAPPRIDRIFLHNPGTNNDYGPEDLDPDLIAQCRLFHFGYPPLMARMYADEGRELQRIFQIAKEAGATTSCDMALPDPASAAGKAPWNKILANVLPYVDIFLPSIEEAFYMLEPESFLQMKQAHGGAELIDLLTPQDYSRIADKLLALGTRMTSLKSGHRGFYVKTADRSTFDRMGAARPADPENWSRRELWCPAFRAPHVASATGSGDSSIGGFLTAFLRGESVERSLQAANCLGWQNVQVLDAISGIQTWERTCELLEEGLERHDVNVHADGWTWEEATGVWRGPSDRTAGVGQPA